MGASRQNAEVIADKVEANLYREIPTKKIFLMANRYLRRYSTDVPLRRDLRTAISLIRPKPDWEIYIQLLMKELGYAVESNRVLRGRCVESEIDGILSNDSETLLLETKHNLDPHTKTSLDIPKEVWATYTDSGRFQVGLPQLQLHWCYAHL